jgi:hypothetical protein
MKNIFKCFILFMILFFSQEMIYPQNLKKISFYDIFSIKLDKEMSIERYEGYLYFDTKIYTNDIQINWKYKNISFPMFARFKINKDIDINKVKLFTKIKKINDTSFMEYDSRFKEVDYSQFIVNGHIITRYIADWGSGFSRDILSYDFEINNNEYFDHCYLDFYNIWPENEEYPEKKISTKYIDELISKGDRRVELYKIIDNIVNNIEFKVLLSKKNEFINKVENLRLRNSPSSIAKIIRNLIKGEKLELIEKGKEETINGVTGNWVKVKTQQGETGWCFDAYLEEVK